MYCYDAFLYLMSTPLPSYELIFKIIDTFLLFLQSMTMMTIFRQKKDNPCKSLIRSDKEMFM